jgi:hypothetical protein
VKIPEKLILFEVVGITNLKIGRYYPRSYKRQEERIKTLGLDLETPV